MIHFTFAGNIGKQQNLENIIKAFCSIKDILKKKCQLNIIGDGAKLDDLRALVSDNSNVVFFGNQKRENMASAITFLKTRFFKLIFFDLKKLT